MKTSGNVAVHIGIGTHEERKSIHGTLTKQHFRKGKEIFSKFLNTIQVLLYESKGSSVPYESIDKNTHLNAFRIRYRWVR